MVALWLQLTTGSWRAGLAHAVFDVSRHRLEGMRNSPRSYCTLGAWLLAVSLTGQAFADDSADRAAPPGVVDLDDRPEILRERVPQSEAARDRIEAVSRFAAGRMQEQQEAYSAALREYQRAWRCDPQALPVLRLIIDLARRLERLEEANRYLVLAAPLAPEDPQFLWQIADALAQADDLPRAARAYEAARKVVPEKLSAGYLLLSLDAARVLFATGQFTEAAAACETALAALANPEEYQLDEGIKAAFAGEAGQKVYALCAAAFLAANQPERAQAAFARWHALANDPAAVAYHSAQVQTALREFPQARSSLQRYLELGGQGDPAPYELLARVLAELKAADDLLPLLSKAVEHDADNGTLRYQYALTLESAGQVADAQRQLEELVRRRPLADAYQKLLAWYLREGALEQALGVLGAVAAQTNGLSVLAEQAAPLTKDPATLDPLIELARQPPDPADGSASYGTHLAVALLALDARRFNEAREFFELALAARPDAAAEVLLSWGVGLLLAEQYADAIAILERGQREGNVPADNPSFTFFLSGALAMAGQTEPALAAARSAVGQNPTSARIASRVPWVLFQCKRLAEAAAAYEQFLAQWEQQPRSAETRAELRQARLVLSNIHVQRNDLPQAEELLELVLDEYPADISAFNDLGYLWADQGKHLARALVMLQQAVAAEPENGAYRDSLGWVLHRLGRNAEALLELQRAVSAGVPDGVILDHLGDVQQALGDHDAARLSWQQAATVMADSSEPGRLAQVRQKLADSPATDP